MNVLAEIESAKVHFKDLQRSRMGKSVQDLRKVADDTVAAKSKLILKKWRKTMKAEKERLKQQAEKKTKNKQEQQQPKQQLRQQSSLSVGTMSRSDSAQSAGSANASSSSDLTLSPVYDPSLPKLRNVARKKFFELFSGVGGDSSSPSSSSPSSSGAAGALDNNSKSTADIVELATRLEMALLSLFPFPRERKAFSKKLRSILFNLRKNVVLTQQVVTGVVSPINLLQMEPHEMLTESERKARDDARQYELDSHRCDYEDVNRHKIMKKVGGASNSLKCPKCKGRKCVTLARRALSLSLYVSFSPSFSFSLLASLCCLLCLTLIRPSPSFLSPPSPSFLPPPSPSFPLPHPSTPKHYVLPTADAQC